MSRCALARPPAPSLLRSAGSDSSSHHPRQQSNTCFNWNVITAGRPPPPRCSRAPSPGAHPARRPAWQTTSPPGIKVVRDGDKLRLDIPAQLTFDINRSDIRSNLYPVFNDIAKVLRDYEKTMLVIAGHTDDTGAYQYNMTLSQARADSVKRYLTAQNVQAIRIETQGYGPSYPIVPNTSEANRTLNRRVEIHIEPVVE